MENTQIIILIASVLCLLSFAECHDDRFFVEGQVYCDTCRTEFVTRVSEFLEGAKVRLECRNRTIGAISYAAEAVTDKNGRYSLAVDGDYQDDICEVLLVKSPREDCLEVPSDPFTRQAAKVSLTSNNGIVDPIRTANPLGFIIRETLPECPEVLKELGPLYD